MYENCTKRAFQDTRRTFWPNRISQRYRSKNRSAGLKFTKSHFSTFQNQKFVLRDWNSRQYVKTVGFVWKLYKTCFSGHAENVLAKSHFSTFKIQKSLYRTEITPIRESSRFTMKIVQNVLFKECRGRFDEIAFLNVSEPKIAPPDWNSRQYVKTVGFPWKLHKTCFSGHAEDVLAKSHFSTFQNKKSLRGLKLTPIRKNSRLSMKIEPNVLFRPRGGRFDQIAFLNVSEPKNRSAGRKFTKLHFSTFQNQK